MVSFDSHEHLTSGCSRGHKQQATRSGALQAAAAVAHGPPQTLTLHPT